MPRKWKVLKNHNVETLSDLADLMLLSLDGLSVVEQFSKQNVDHVCKRKLLCWGLAYIDKDISKWIIVLNIRNTIDENLFTLGHELAHTFAREKRGGRLVDMWRTKGGHGQLEDFCDIFSQKWLQQRDNVEQLKKVLTDDVGGKILFRNRLTLS